ncbi:hypothetical protein DJ010_02520 [Nocardioides silvaticus]|uniref:Uncharacterized protein n=1 Tax=Nocardioides silvaticus TaxID=2201891 RepID=A0A316TQL2_9ACTN|nr:hypothetical protein DJ010_02520 [Nocardioides silvaticus]
MLRWASARFGTLIGMYPTAAEALLIAAGISLVLVMAALGVARLNGTGFAIGIAGLAIVGSVVGDWVVTIWFYGLSMATSGGGEGLLEVVYYGHPWLTPLGLVTVARWPTGGGSADSTGQVRRSSRFHHGRVVEAGACPVSARLTASTPTTMPSLPLARIGASMAPCLLSFRACMFFQRSEPKPLSVMRPVWLAASRYALA